MTVRRRALIIAADDYSDPGLRAPATMGDVHALADALRDPEVGEFEVEVVTNRPAYAIRHTIDDVLATAGRDDLALLYIGGVGISDRGDLFVAGSDTRPAYVRSSGLEAAFIRRALDRSRARQAALILDCRFGAAVARGSATTETIDVAEHFGPHAPSSDRTRVLITASTAVEFVIEDGKLVGSPPAEQSVFTRAFAHALRAGGDDGAAVSLDAVYDDIRAHAQIPGRTPGKWQFGPARAVIIAGAPAATATTEAAAPPDPAPAAPPPTESQPVASAAPQAGGIDQRVARPRARAPRRPLPYHRIRGSRGFGRWLVAAAVGLGLIASLTIRGSGGERRAGSETGAMIGSGASAQPDAVLSASVCLPFEDPIPAQTSSACGPEIVGALFSPLVEYDERTSSAAWGNAAPRAMAADVRSEDQRVWTIRLKEGWTFHDGTPVAAQGFVDAWNHHAYAPNAAAWGFVFSIIDGYSDMQCGADDDPDTCTPASDKLRGLTAVDDETIRVTLSQPLSQFPLVLTALAFSPLPDSFHDNPAAYRRELVGTGPFRMDGEWRPSDGIRLVRYEDYAGQPAAIDGLELHLMREGEVSYASFNAGELDIAWIPPDRMSDARGEHSDTYVEGSNSRYEYLGFPTDDDRFANPALRRAISMAIDREAITQTILPDASPADAFLPPSVAGYRARACDEACSYDPQRARRELDRGGGFEGTLTLWFNSGGGHEPRMEAIAEQIRDNLDVDVTLKRADFGDYLERLSDGKMTGPYRLGKLMDYPSAQSYLQSLLHSSSTSNFTRWSKPRFDRQIDAGNAAPSVGAALDSYHRAEDTAVRDMPLVPLFFHKNAVVHAEHVRNVHLNHAGFVEWADVTVDDPAIEE